MSNKKKGFLLPPAVGYSFKILIRLVRKNKISLIYYPRLIAICLINLINLPFRSYERLFINPKYKKKNINKNPVFILGHWRSGTTHLHNLLCKDPKMAYITTYQSVFPDTIFNKLGRFIFAGFSSLMIPGTRKGDNVTLGISLPQEEEFALGDKIPISFYYFWLFPKNILKYYNDFIRFNNIKNKQFKLWILNYKLLITKAIKNTNGEVFISKNPPNTGRIKILLEMFPNAKFIHIHRNPIEVFLSTQNFYNKMLLHLQMQKITKTEIDDKIIQIYKNMMNDYFDQRKFIPESNLIEVSFEELEKNTIQVLREIYSKLNLKGFGIAKPNFDKYLDSMKNYKKNQHSISRGMLNKLMKEWKFSMKELNYEVPNNIKITDD